MMSKEKFQELNPEIKDQTFCDTAYQAYVNVVNKYRNHEKKGRCANNRCERKNKKGGCGCLYAASGNNDDNDNDDERKNKKGGCGCLYDDNDNDDDDNKRKNKKGGCGCLSNGGDDDDNDNSNGIDENELYYHVRRGGGALQKMNTTKPTHTVKEFNMHFFHNADTVIQDYGCKDHQQLANSDIKISFRQYEELLHFAKQHGKVDLTVPKNAVIRKGGFTYKVDVKQVQESLLLVTPSSSSSSSVKIKTGGSNRINNPATNANANTNTTTGVSTNNNAENKTKTILLLNDKIQQYNIVHEQYPKLSKQEIVSFVEQKIGGDGGASKKKANSGGNNPLLLLSGIVSMNNNNNYDNYKTTCTKDMETLQSDYIWVQKYAKQHNISIRPVFWEKTTILGKFQLKPDYNNVWPNPKTLLKPEFLPDLSMEKICIGQLQRQDSVIRRRWASEGNRSSLQCDVKSSAAVEFAHPHKKTMTFSIKNALTGCFNKWKDSAFIDAALHVLLEHHKEKKRIVIWSAEDDPTVEDLLYIRKYNEAQDCSNTPEKKMLYLFIPLFDRDHWSASFVDMRPGHEYIYYLDSDLPYTHIRDRNMTTVQQVFPYNIRIISCLKQQDHFNCGTYVCYWAYCMLYDRTRLLQLNATQINEYGKLLRRQVLLYFTQETAPTSLVKDPFHSCVSHN